MRPRHLSAAAILFLAALAACLPAGGSGPVPARPELVEDVDSVRRVLERERTAVRLASGEDPARRALRLIALGLFQDADSLLSSAPRSVSAVAAQAELRFRQYRFDESRALVEQLLRQQPGNRAVRLLALRLGFAAGEDEWVEAEARARLRRGRRDADAAALIGRVRLRHGDPEGAREWAERVRTWAPAQAEGWLLQAEAHVEEGEPTEALEALRQGLTVDPLDPEARFAYGLLLERLSDPAPGGRAADQWRLAVEIDPLHAEAHRYLASVPVEGTSTASLGGADPAVRTALTAADSLAVAGRIAEAIEQTRGVQLAVPESPLPALWRGSYWYLLAPRQGGLALDSALASFRTALSAAPTYGPAHAGIAAVLRTTRTRALASYDSLEASLAGVPAHLPAELESLFPGLDFDSDGRVVRMVLAQLAPLRPLLPLLARRGARIHVLRLHDPAATVGGEASAPEATSVKPAVSADVKAGGAAVGIADLEIGSHGGESVLLREVTRLLFHEVLTDSQRRRIRALRLSVMERGDDAGADAADYLARGVDAYTASGSATRARARTREELLREDPDLFAFVEVFLQDLAVAAAGAPDLLRPNRAEVMVKLAREALAAPSRGGRGIEEAAVLLDSALLADPRYLPAMIEYAGVESVRGRVERGAEWLVTAEAIDPQYSPIQVARADLLAHEESASGTVVESRFAFLRRAIEVESDPVVRAQHYERLWRLYEAQGRLADAIIVAQERAEGAVVSGGEVRLLASWRQRARDEVMRLRMRAGYAEEAYRYFGDRAAGSPLNLEMQGRYADALALAGLADEAVEVMAAASTRSTATDDAPGGVHLRLAELRLATGDTGRARYHVDRVLDFGAAPQEVDGRLIRLLVSLGESTEAQRQLTLLPHAVEPGEQAELAFTRGWVSAWRGDVETTERLYREAIALDPYHLSARAALHRLLITAGRVEEARLVEQQASTLPLPLGPGFGEALRRGE